MQWTRGIRIGLLFFLGFLLSACAADGGLQFPPMTSTPYPPPGYAHRVATSHVALYWNCTQPEPGMLQLAGLAFNPWANQPVGFFEFDLVGVNANERAASQAKAQARDLQIFTNQSTTFQLDLRMAGDEIRFDLYYQYRFQEGDHNRIFAGPVVGGPFLLAQQTNRFLARDVCSDTQHLAR